MGVLGGFQARCLRNILRIRPSYTSLASNKTVLEKAQQQPFTTQLLQQQLLLYGKVGREEDGNLLRDITFCPHSLRAATDRYIRRTGRPRNEWTKQVWKVAMGIARDKPLEELVASAAAWEIMVRKYCSSL